MKLSLIYSDLLRESFKARLRAANPLMAVMPRYKQKHSARVGQSLHKAGVPEEGIFIGLLHDYLERGGDLDTLQQHLGDLGLPARTVQIIQSLTNPDKSEPDESEGNATLAHLQHVIPNLDEDTRNITILAKMADRLDNLRRRVKKKRGITRQYQRKSLEIIQYLASFYEGPSRYFAYLANSIAKLLGVRGFSYG
jgi:(p)ppGpp synthase/HD superfamily hydrolase